ncbi:hypothetical protein BX16_22570 [Escherichia coli O91:NM str. 2009C-3745]|nr:hypothetical protein BX16_22570 [Escherichia coli O91:NM str. 2009C-3745]
MPWLCWFTNSRISCLCMCKKKPPEGGCQLIDVRRLFRRLAICFSFSISALIICSSLCSIRSNSSLNALIEVALVLPSSLR